MTTLYKQHRLATTLPNTLFILLLTITSASGLHAEPVAPKVIEITLGDYRFMPGNILLNIDQPVILRLVNADALTPHNFTLEGANDGLDVNVDIPAGDVVDVPLKPLVAGRHSFYCRKKLMLMKSHREKGMVGTLTVVPAQQDNQQTQ